LTERWKNNFIAPVLLAILLFLPTLKYAFAVDDHWTIETNPHLTIWPGWLRVFTSDIWLLTNFPTISNFFRPMFFLTNWSVAQWLTRSSWGFHLVNVLLDAAVVFLVWLVSRTLFDDTDAAFWAGLLFAAHPIHTEAVAWIDDAPDLGCTAFFLLAFYLYLRWDRYPAAAVLCPACHLMSLLWKESGITFLGVVIAYDLVFRRPLQWRRYLPILGSSAFYLLMRYVALKRITPADQGSGVSFVKYLSGISDHLQRYFAKLVFPYPLSFSYPTRTPSLSHALIVAACAVVLFILFRRFREILWGLVWIGITLSPSLWASYNYAPAERNLYLPSVGFIWAIAFLLSRWSRPFGAVVRLALLVVFIAVTLTRLPDWRDDLTLYSATLKQYPDNQVIRMSLVEEFERRGMAREAVDELDRILSLNPANVGAIEVKAYLVSSRGERPLARSLCARALELNGNSRRCLRLLAIIDQAEGDTDAALRKLNQVLTISAGDPDALYQRGTIYALRGQLDEALSDFESSLATHPTAEIFNNIGSVHLEKGQFQMALEAYESALRLNPQFILARQNLKRAQEAMRPN
jgi:protein O-mannosyl-transferase